MVSSFKACEQSCVSFGEEETSVKVARQSFKKVVSSGTQGGREGRGAGRNTWGGGLDCLWNVFVLKLDGWSTNVCFY